jgi:hypothetical protein
MIGRSTHPEITLFAGRFGSGKTEVAINFALSLARQARATVENGHRARLGVILLDLDIVTPYFRTRETADAMRERGVEVIAPSVVGQHLDTPAITPQILGAIQQRERPTVVDVGGDRQGAPIPSLYWHASGVGQVHLRDRGKRPTAGDRPGEQPEPDGRDNSRHDFGGTQHHPTICRAARFDHRVYLP